jgi:hypothetical protein
MIVLSCFDGISACQQAFKNIGIENILSHLSF